MNLQDSKLLVTGGAGFIGSSLIWALNQQAVDNILIADFLDSSDKFKNLVPLQFDDYIEADKLLDIVENKPAQLEEIRGIFHLGACSSTKETNVRYLIENNYEYTKTLAHWAIEKGKRFVYASSAATYGDGSQGMDDQRPEGIPQLRPLNGYAYSKQLFDRYALRQGWLDSVIGLKYFNVFGPNESHKGEMRSMAFKAFDQIVQTGKVRLFKSYHPDYKDGEQKRDFLYVKDAVKWTLNLAEIPTASGIFNIGSGKAHTWIELVKPLFDLLDKPVQIDFIAMPEALQPKYQYHTCARIEKWHRTLKSAGYPTAVTPLADAVSDYVRHYLIPGKTLGA